MTETQTQPTVPRRIRLTATVLGILAVLAAATAAVYAAGERSAGLATKKEVIKVEHSLTEKIDKVDSEVDKRIDKVEQTMSRIDENVKMIRTLMEERSE